MPGWPQGVGRHALEETDSTNSAALRMARGGEAPPFWLIAGRQSAGRGRRGRSWSTEPGNFAATHLMRAPVPPGQGALRAFAAGLALRDALVGLGCPADRLALKWPNDLLLDGAKLAGMLLEGGGTHLAIGIGVNLATSPPAEGLEAGALAPVDLRTATGIELAPDALLDRLAAEFARREAELAHAGFAPLRAAWLDHASHLGRPVTARLPRGEVTGIFETLDETGALVLAVDGGRRVIHAADIFPMQRGEA
ncbi:MAG: biotin--[acetyl-CoA-carboxylase] ligase [Alphaproteobacteria bacterium]|nr:MAG: biotin--[acetyl-CoA-carboxylase] ligase [Alphaproteobacteria bacterium]